MRIETIRETMISILRAIRRIRLSEIEIKNQVSTEPKTDIKTAELIFWNWYDFMIVTNWEKLNELEKICGGQRALLTMYLRGELPIVDLAGESWKAIRGDFETCGVILPTGASASSIIVPFDVRRQMTLY